MLFLTQSQQVDPQRSQSRPLTRVSIRRLAVELDRLLQSPSDYCQVSKKLKQSSVFCIDSQDPLLDFLVAVGFAFEIVLRALQLQEWKKGGIDFQALIDSVLCLLPVTLFKSHVGVQDRASRLSGSCSKALVRASSIPGLN